jgi:hypothetical protein
MMIGRAASLPTEQYDARATSVTKQEDTDSRENRVSTVAKATLKRFGFKNIMATQ